MAVAERRYSPDHVWLDATGELGVTQRLIERMPEIIAVHLPDVGAELRVASAMAALEGNKGTVDLYAPCTGVVLARNEGALEDPTAILRDPEGTWLLRIDGAPGRLLTADEYAARG